MEIGDIVWRHDYGVGRIVDINIYSLTPYLVYFYKEDNRLHDGAIEPRSCPDNHGWWFSSGDIKRMKCLPPLASLIERRQQ